MAVTLFYTILYYAALICVVIMSLAVLVATIQVIIFNRRHERREVEQSLREVEYHHKRMRS